MTSMGDQQRSDPRRDGLLAFLHAVAAIPAILTLLISDVGAAAPDEKSIANASDEALRKGFDRLRQGGLILVMRHANSPPDQAAPVGMSNGCTLQAGRGLDAAGLYQAKSIGEWLRAEGVVIHRAYTSRYCRAWDTAVLVAAGAPVIEHASQATTDPAAIADFRAFLGAEIKATPKTNILLVSHSNVAPLYGATPDDDEEELPSGAVFAVDPATGAIVFRFDLQVEHGPQTVTVD